MNVSYSSHVVNSFGRACVVPEEIRKGEVGIHASLRARCGRRKARDRRVGFFVWGSRAVIGPCGRRSGLLDGGERIRHKAQAVSNQRGWQTVGGHDGSHEWRCCSGQSAEEDRQDRADGWPRRGRKVVEGEGESPSRALMLAGAGADDGPRVAESH
jgi:hypothetical protein